MCARVIGRRNFIRNFICSDKHTCCVFIFFVISYLRLDWAAGYELLLTDLRRAELDKRSGARPSIFPPPIKSKRTPHTEGARRIPLNKKDMTRLEMDDRADCLRAVFALQGRVLLKDDFFDFGRLVASEHNFMQFVTGRAV